MERSLVRAATALVVGALALYGCSGAGTNGVPAAGAPSQAIRTQSGTATTNVAGQYVGTVVDSASGSGSATASLAQYAAAVGGDLAFTYGSTTIDAQVGAEIANTNSLPGTIVAGSRPCSFSVSATYDSSKHKLAGSYQAFSGCRGETGSFTLKEQCYYVRNRGGNDATKPDTPGLKPCGK